MGKKCLDCDKRPSFNFEDECLGIYCVAHKKEGMMNVISRKCLSCNKKPLYNYRDTKPGIYCNDHKLENMVNVYAKICEFDGCDSEVESRNGITGVLPKFCEKHKNKISGICKSDTCFIRATFNFENEKIPIYCGEHKLEGMICIVNKRCQYGSCKKGATHNLLGEKTPIYCAEHAGKDMLNIKCKKCEQEGCNIIPAYGFKGEPPTRCKTHKLDGMHDYKSKRCSFEGCEIRPTFNFEGLKAEFCATHKKEGMVNSKDKTCIAEGCKVIPVFNYENESKPLYCNLHKSLGMIDIYRKTCKFIGCKVRPCCNFAGLKAEFCATHKKEGMVNVVSKKCEHDGCDKISNFNLPGEKEGKFCSIHKLNTMVDIKHKTCIEEGCSKQPIFNYENEKTAIYCCEHKLEKMINIKDKCCKYPDCKTRASFNLEGLSPEYCGKHKSKDMINIRARVCEYEGCKVSPMFNFPNEKTPKMCGKHKEIGMVSLTGVCEAENCYKKATYNLEGQSPKFCATHKSEKMINVRHKKCKTPYCEIIASNTKYEGYCSRCFMYTFPDKPMARNYKTKEKAVSDFVMEQIPEVDWISDKRIMDGCSKRRPDLLVDLGDQVVIVEIDENQHEDYDCSCENKRLMELSQDLGHRPLVLIRFNPDSYTDKEGNKIKSCWKVNKLGIYRVDSDKKWKARLDTLKNITKYWIENRTDKTIEVVHLFYDES